MPNGANAIKKPINIFAEGDYFCYNISGNYFFRETLFEVFRGPYGRNPLFATTGGVVANP